MGLKGAPVQPPTFQTSRNNTRRAEDGFTLLEVICVLAILSILALFVVPALPRGTSRAKLESYAIATATLLKVDRNAALRRHTDIATEVDAKNRIIRSGATGRSVRVPNDVDFDTLRAARCDPSPTQPAILFFSSGLSCGGVITLSKGGNRYQVRVNWLTGEIDIVPSKGT